MDLYRKPDPAIPSIVLSLCTIGALMVYSASFIFAEERTGDGYYFIKRQLLFLTLGCGSFVLGAKLSVEWLKNNCYKLLGILFLILIAVLIPGIGTKVGGAQRWLGVGAFRFQPAEVTKFLVIVFLARQLDKNYTKLREFKYGVIATLLVPLPFLMLLLLQPDFGTSVIIVTTTLMMMFVAGVRPLWLFSAVGLALSSGTLLVISSSYRMARFAGFMDPWRDPAGKGFQVIQSMLGVYQGGVWGQGLGNGKEKLFYLPEAHNDFIFAVLGEELGLFGIGIVILLFVILITKGLLLSLKRIQEEHDRFGGLLALGLISMIAIQAFFNMGVVLGVLPTKGLTLPFVSYGGSSLIVNLFCMGIVYQLSGAKK